MRGLIGDEFGFGGEWVIGERGRRTPLQFAKVEGRRGRLHQ
jgi:hypothetical protein